jgi:hypothetical protein
MAGKSAGNPPTPAKNDEIAKRGLIFSKYQHRNAKPFPRPTERGLIFSRHQKKSRLNGREKRGETVTPEETSRTNAIVTNLPM